MNMKKYDKLVVNAAGRLVPTIINGKEIGRAHV